MHKFQLSVPLIRNVVLAEGEESGNKPDDSSAYIPKSEYEALASKAAVAEAKLNETLAKMQEMQKSFEATKHKYASIDDPEKFLEELESFRQKDEEAKLKNASEIEKISLEMEKMKNQFQAALKDKEKELKAKTDLIDANNKVVAEMRRASLRADILAAASGKAHNPEQVVALVINDFSLGDDGTFKTLDGKNPSEYVKAYLSRKENANLLRTIVAPDHEGVVPTPSSSNPGDKYIIDKDGFMKLGRPLTEQEKREAIMNNVSDREYEDRVARTEKLIAEAQERQKQQINQRHPAIILSRVQG